MHTHVPHSLIASGSIPPLSLSLYLSLSPSHSFANPCLTFCLSVPLTLCLLIVYSMSMNWMGNLCCKACSKMDEHWTTFICCNTHARAKAKPNRTCSQGKESDNCTYTETDRRDQDQKGLFVCMSSMETEGTGYKGGGDGSEGVASIIGGSKATFSVVFLVKYRTGRQLTTESSRQRFAVIWRTHQIKRWRRNGREKRRGRRRWGREVRGRRGTRGDNTHTHTHSISLSLYYLPTVSTGETNYV